VVSRPDKDEAVGEIVTSGLGGAKELGAHRVQRGFVDVDVDGDD
jgi:hypothetical protein